MIRLYIEEGICSGCRMCEYMCSFFYAKEFNMRKSRITILKDVEKGIDKPVTECDGIQCAEQNPKGIPWCVEFCRPGALIFAEKDEAIKMKKEWLANKDAKPTWKAQAPWARGR